MVMALLACGTPAAMADPGYAMYVWSDGFDATVPGCDEARLLAWDPNADAACYVHNWLTPMSRQWLWDTVKRPGRQVERVFISDVRHRLEAGYPGDCSHPDVELVRNMLRDGHCKAPHAGLYALFSTGNPDVSEQFHVPFVVWYNDTCASGPNERFDGVAVNNEAWNDIKCTTPTAEQAYLDDLQAVADAAELQINGTLATHYSIGWKWSFCGATEASVDWDGTIQPATHHMIDIFDSVDVQVAWVAPETAADRALTAGYAHAVGQGKPFHVLSFTNTRDPCTTTHFPEPCAASPWTDPLRSDSFLMTGMFDDFPANGIPQALGGIHAYRRVYSSGGHTDWPSYYSGSVKGCIFEAFAGPLDFAQPDDDSVIDWPEQANATVYELARADDPRFDTGCRTVAITSSTSAIDTEIPAPGETFHYLVRVAAPDPGNWGPASTGEPRTGQCL